MKTDFKKLFETSGKPNDVVVIERLSGSKHPVVLYGASPDVADSIVKKLARHQISIALVAFDADSRHTVLTSALLKDVEAVSAGELDKRFKQYHVVLGFVKGYSQIALIAPKFRNALSVDYLSEIFDMEIITPSFVAENSEILEDFYENLQDQLSKDSFIAYLKSKTRQDMQYLPPVFDKMQYFPRGLFQFTDHESYFDGGAFIGDTINDFLKATDGVYRRIWAVEPDRANFRQLTKYIEEANLQDIEAINKGIYGFTGKLPFREDGSMLSMLAEDAHHSIDVDTIDHIVGSAPVTYIKLDVEGAELMALKGAEHTIRANKPLLGVSIYHKQQDMIAIPLYIKQLVPEYKFYFRVHKKLAIDTILYAVVC